MVDRDMDQLNKVSDEAHHDEAQSDGTARLNELCNAQGRCAIRARFVVRPSTARGTDDGRGVREAGQGARGSGSNDEQAVGVSGQLMRIYMRLALIVQAPA